VLFAFFSCSYHHKLQLLSPILLFFDKTNDLSVVVIPLEGVADEADELVLLA
jgi:hypothetical protein